MKNLFKKAHKLTKEIKAEYPEVDYKAQFGLCLSFLHIKKEEEVKMEDKDYRVETKVELLDGKEVKVPSKVTIKVLDIENTFNVEWNGWIKYGKKRLYAKFDGKRFGFLDCTNENDIKNELDGHLGRAFKRFFQK